MTTTISKDYCPKCQQITNHNCLFTKKKENFESNPEFHWGQNFETIQCLGCENIQFRYCYYDENMYEYTEAGYEGYEEFKYYPKNLPNHSLLNSLYSLPHKLRIVYVETIEALKNNCYLLSGVGLRAIIEAICLNQKITGRNLEVKINNLVKNKLITEKDGNRLHSIRFLGNDSVHEMDVPKEEKLRTALDIVEHLIKNLYLIDISVSRHLDTIISQYDEFRSLFLRKFKATAFSTGDEKSIKEVFDKDFRRLEKSYLPNFEQQLIDEIKAETITTISIGKLENNQQYFIKN